MSKPWRRLGGLALAAALAACVAGEPPVTTVTAADVPLRFAHGGLGERDATYEAMKDPRTGFTVRRASYHGTSEFAVFDVVELLGDRYIPQETPGAYIERYIKPEVRIERGASGSLGGARQTRWRAFRLLGEDGGTCVALQRTLREHVEGGIGHGSQALVTGIYCRAGEDRIEAEEADRIAAGLSA